MSRFRIRSNTLVSLIAVVGILILAACSNQGDPTDGRTQNGDAPQVAISLLVGGAPQPMGPDATQVAGPQSQFLIEVRDRSGTQRVTYSFNGGEQRNLVLDAAGRATIEPAAPLTGSRGSLAVSVTNNHGRSITETVSFNIDSVPPVISSIILDGVERVSSGMPTVQLGSGSTGGAVLEVTAADSGAFASNVRIMLVIGEDVVTTGIGRLNYVLTGASLSEGVHRARIFAVDDAGNVSTNFDFQVSVVALEELVAPVITIASPADNAIVRAGADYAVVVNVTRGSAEVASVHVELEDTALSSLDNRRFTGTAPSQAGDYVLQAWAVGSDGETSEVVTQTLQVSDDEPLLTITNPGTDNQQYAPGATVHASLSVFNGGGGIGAVTMTLNGARPAAVSGYNYEFIAPADSGSYDLVATASSASGQSISRQVRTIEVVEEAAPAVSILSPGEGSVIRAGAVMEVLLSVQNTGSGIDYDSIEVSVGGDALVQSASDPLRFTGAAPATAGPAMIIARAASAGAAPQTSQPAMVQVTVSDDAPGLLITAPSAGSQFAPGSIVRATLVVTDAGGGVDESSIAMSLDGALPPSRTGLNFDFTAPLVPGNYELVATADSASGGSTSRVTTTIEVVAEIAPVVTILSPAEGEVVPAGSSVRIELDIANSGSGIGDVDVFLNGAQLTPLSPGGWIYEGTVPDVAGTSSIRAIAASAGAAPQTSIPALRNVMVSDTPPVVEIRQQALKQLYRPGETILVDLGIEDAGGGIGPMSVTLGGTAMTPQADNTFTAPAPLTDGPYTLQVTVGNHIDSRQTVVTQQISVQAPPAPTVTIVGPLPPHNTVGAGDLVTVDLELTDNSGGISYTSIIVTLDDLPMAPLRDPVTGITDYTTWTRAAPGPLLPGEMDRFVIRASAANADETRRSATVEHELFVDVTPPTVQLVRPGYAGHVPARIGELEIEVQAEDHGSDILEIIVEAYRHNSTAGTWIPIATFTEDQSGVIDWNLEAGGWFLRATARDRFGNVGISESVPVFSADGDIPINTNLVLREPVVNEMIVSPNDDLTFVISHLTRELYLDTVEPEGWVELYLGTELVSPAVPITFGTSAAFGDFAEINWTVPALEPGDYTFWIWHHHVDVYGLDASGAEVLVAPAARTHQPVILRVQ